jgi:hypothetical protein
VGQHGAVVRQERAVDEPTTYQVTINTYTITLPQLTGPDPTVADRVNAAVGDYVREVQAQAFGATLTLKAGNPYIGAEVLSLSFGGDWYVQGTAHPTKIASGLVFDLRNGDRIGIQDVFTDTDSGLRLLQPVVRAQLESRFPGSEADFDVVTEPVPSNYEQFVVNQRGLVVIVVDLPYVIGPQSVLVKWDRLVDLVDPKLVDVLRS